MMVCSPDENERHVDSPGDVHAVGSSQCRYDLRHSAEFTLVRNLMFLQMIWTDMQNKAFVLL